MITFDNGGVLIQAVHELPAPRRCRLLFGDCETTSGHPKRRSLNPWIDCDVLGWAFTWDANPQAFYVPVNHRHVWNCPREVFDQWISDWLDAADEWVNHNIKYDGHVLANCSGALRVGTMVDTVVRGQIIDSDRMLKGGYGLDVLSRDCLGEDISRYEERLKPYLVNSMDYAAVACDVMAEYGCQDVLTNRRLYHWQEAACPEQCRRVWTTETELTECLFEIERTGLRVNPTQLQIQQLLSLNRMSQIDAELTKLVGYSFQPHVNGDCFDVLCNHYGLPVMRWTEVDDIEDLQPGESPGNPSFDKEALAMYRAHPLAPVKVLDLIKEYRKHQIRESLFLRKYLNLQTDGKLHPFYKQVKRTGRMGCVDPNAQQLDEWAKGLILPDDGCAFLSIDYAQIEFRTMMHYIEDASAIEAYKRDPDMDFHQFVADHVVRGIKRRPAKTMNFLMGFGGGKKRTKRELMKNPDIVEEVKRKVDLMVEGGMPKEEIMAAFNTLLEDRAEGVFNSYHGGLPGIKRVSGQACRAAEAKGYVFNARGRRCHLPKDRAHIAFNRLNQSLAADIMKERTVAAWKALKGTPISIAASVHDETLFHGPKEAIEDPRTVCDAIALLEAHDVDLLVPIRTSCGVSDKSWAKAAKCDVKIMSDRCNDFAHLKAPR